MSTTTAGIIFFVTLAIALAATYRPFGDYMARVFQSEKHLAPGALDLPHRADRPGCRADVGRLPAKRAGVLADLRARPVRLPAGPAGAPVRPPVRGAADARRPGVQHRGQLRHQHQLAVLLRRERPGLRRPGGGPDGAELRLCGRRYRRGHRSCARLHPQPHGSARQLLGGPHPDLHPDPAADLVRRRDRPDRRRSHRDLGALPDRHGPTGASQTLPGGAIASQEAIKELGTNGGGFFNANSCSPVREPDGVDELAGDLPAACHQLLACRARSGGW